MSVQEYFTGLISKKAWPYISVLYLSDTTCAVIGQFRGAILYCTACYFKAVFVARMFCVLSPSVLKFHDEQKFKLLFTLSCVLKCANDLITISILTRFAFNVHQ